MNIELREPIIFIVCGKARSGKSTATEYIRQYYESKNKQCLNLMYAESIKNYAKKIIHWNGKEETKPRTFLQQLGTEIIRNQIDPHFFTKRMIDDLHIYSYFFDVLTISDARFVDEISEPKKQFKKVIVLRIEKQDMTSELTEGQQQHVSENALNDFSDYDYIIQNNGTLEDLKQKIYNILDEVKE